MAKSTPEWITVLTVFIGGGGLLGLLKYINDLKNKEVDILNKQLKSTEQALKKAEERESHNFDILTEAIQGIDKGGLSAQDAARFKKIISLIQERRSLSEELNDYKNAARWLAVKKEAWINDAIRETSRIFRKEIPRSKNKSFREDISYCLDWVYQCLYLYGHPNVSLKQFMVTPSILSQFPYIRVIQLIIDNKDWGTLTKPQVEALEGMLEELIERLPAEFSRRD